jgi:hypothetical protein
VNFKGALVCVLMFLLLLTGCSTEEKRLEEYADKHLSSNFSTINTKIIKANKENFRENLDSFLQKKKDEKQILSDLEEYKGKIKYQQKALAQIKVNGDLNAKHKKEIKQLYSNYSNLLNGNIEQTEQMEDKIKLGKTITNSDYLIALKKLSRPIVVSNANLITFLENNDLTKVKREIRDGNGEHMGMDMDHM